MKHYDVVAAVVVNEQRQILCARRGVTRYAYTSLKYEFPGGKIEPGETPQEALRRELREELDYDVRVERPLCVVNYAYPDFSISLQAFVCSPRSPHLILREHHDVRWLSPDELDGLDWAAADRRVVAVLQADMADPDE